MRIWLFVAAVLLASDAFAQSIGQFRWQLQPYCNVVTLDVTPVGAGYRLEGSDDQCGAATRAPVFGLAVLNANGTIELGFSLVGAAPAGPSHVGATISLPSLGGTWRDANGLAGTLVFTPGSGTGGVTRPGGSIQFRATGTNTQLIPNNSSTVITNWSSVSYNDGGGTYVPATGTFTIPVAGLYEVTTDVYWSPFNASGLGLTIQRNGIGIAQTFGQAAAATTSGVIQNVTTVFRFVGGDTVRIVAFQASGSTQEVNVAASGVANFTVTRLR